MNQQTLDQLFSAKCASNLTVAEVATYFKISDSDVIQEVSGIPGYFIATVGELENVCQNR